MFTSATNPVLAKGLFFIYLALDLVFKVNAGSPDLAKFTLQVWNSPVSIPLLN